MYCILQLDRYLYSNTPPPPHYPQKLYTDTAPEEDHIFDFFPGLFELAVALEPTVKWRSGR